METEDKVFRAIWGAAQCVSTIVDDDIEEKDMMGLIDLSRMIDGLIVCNLPDRLSNKIN